MAWLEALRAAPGETAALVLMAAAALAALAPARLAGIVAAAATLIAAAWCVDGAWRADPATAPGAVLGALAALSAAAAVAVCGADAIDRRGAVRLALALLAGAGLTFAAASADLAWALIGLWLAGLSAAAILGMSAAPRAAQDGGQVLNFWGLACGLGLIGAALQMLAGAGADRLAVAGWTLSFTALAALAGLAPLNGLQVRSAGLGGAGGLIIAVAGPVVALGLALRTLADAPAALATPAAGALGLIAAGFAALQMVLAADVRRALAGLMATQTAVCLAAAALALAAGARSGAEAAGLALMAMTLGGLAGFCALEALCPGRPADAAAIRGRAAQAPFAAATLAITLVGFMGAPLTFAFFGRWLTLGAALDQGWTLGAVALVISALATAALAARWLALVYARPEADQGAAAAPAAPMAAFAGVIAAAACILFGLFADWPLALADLAFAALARSGGP